MAKVLVVDDDPHIRDVISFALRREGFSPVEAADGRDALSAIRLHQPVLVILDILMPELDGIEVCQVIRAEASDIRNVPILFLSSRDAEADRVKGLDVGGDDYITKPFSPRELIARVKAQLRRAEAVHEPVDRHLAVGPVDMDLDAHIATVNGETIDLTRTEFGLLATLARQPGRVFDRDELMRGAYAEHRVVSERTIDSHMRRLRQKLRASGLDPIETVHGSGFKLSVTAPATD